MIIQRHYQPDAAISDELVEALYQLLMDGGSNGSETQQAALAAAPVPTCFPDSNE